MRRIMSGRNRKQQKTGNKTEKKKERKNVYDA